MIIVMVILAKDLPSISVSTSFFKVSLWLNVCADGLQQKAADGCYIHFTACC